MSTTATLAPVASLFAPLHRAVRRTWLRYRIWSAERDSAGLVNQMRKDREQARAYRKDAGAWRVELALLEIRQ